MEELMGTIKLFAGSFPPIKKNHQQHIVHQIP
jgi:hypothetical protein